MKVYLENVCRYSVSVFSLIYAIRKIFGGQFYMNGELPGNVSKLTLEEVDSFTLAWTFMGYSYSYVLIIGLLQVAGAILLIRNRTKLIGILILFPIIVNILIIDILFLKILSVIVLSTLLLTMLIIIVFLNKNVLNVILKTALRPKIQNSSTRIKMISIILTILNLIVIIGICYVIEIYTWKI